MQLEGMLLLLVMIIIIPVLSIVSNDTAFFTILSLVLSFSSIKNIITTFFPVINEEDEETKELLEELEENIDFDIHKIGKGLDTAKALIIILFFIYSSFFVDLILYKVAISFIIVYWIRYIVKSIKSIEDVGELSSDGNSSFFEKGLGLLINILSLFIILTSAYNIFLK